jgi:hypothetical protein
VCPSGRTELLDSVAIERLDFATGAVDSVAFMRHAAGSKVTLEPGATAAYVLPRDPPLAFGSSDQWAVGPDGRIAVVAGDISGHALPRRSARSMDRSSPISEFSFPLGTGRSGWSRGGGRSDAGQPVGLLIDTSALVALERSATPMRATPALALDSIAIPAIVYAELLAGVHLADTETRAAARRTKIEAVVARAPVVEFDAGAPPGVWCAGRSLG